MTYEAQWLTLDEASRATSVNIATIRAWCNEGSIEVGRRGEFRVVRLDKVLEIASGLRARPASKLERSTLRRMLNGSMHGAESGRVAGLQELIRDRLQPA
jgi:hypothetical protein